MIENVTEDGSVSFSLDELSPGSHALFQVTIRPKLHGIYESTRARIKYYSGLPGYDDLAEDKNDSHVDNIVNQILYTIDEMNRQESFQSKYPSLEFKSSEDLSSIVVNIEEFWYPVYSSTSGFSYNENLIKNVNNFLQRENDLIAKGYKYWYATVNSDGSIAVSETESWALESRKDLNSYVKCIGDPHASDRIVLLFPDRNVS
eukprot:gene17407-22956_t